MPNEKQLVIETPEIHNSKRMQAYIAQEIGRPCKQWIHQVISAKRETERIRLRTEEFVLLPDVECINKSPYTFGNTKHCDERQPHSNSPVKYPCQDPCKDSCKDPCKDSCKDPCKDPCKAQFAAQAPVDRDSNRFSGGISTPRERERPPRINRITRSSHLTQLEFSERRWRMKRSAAELHWLAVVTDPSLRTLRDLRGHHIPMLTRLHAECCGALQKETGIPQDQIIAYVHYPPSVYQLHVHFKHPISSHTSYDAFRMHSLASIINNLRVDPEYYAVSHIQLPVYQHTELYTALGLKPDESDKDPDPSPPQRPDSPGRDTDLTEN